jgi:hypothetical protein
MANPTILQLGAWNPLTDSFIAHPRSPTGAIINLNDGVTWSLVESAQDNEGYGKGLDLGQPQPDVYEPHSPRFQGARPVKRIYSANRQIVAHLLTGRGTSYASWIAALHNLGALCEAISIQSPAALQIQVTGASAPLYADVVEAHVITVYKEVEWSQLIDDDIIVAFEARPMLRGPKTTLSNLVWNPGFEQPSSASGGVTVFNDPIANLNTYHTVAGSPTTTYNQTYVDIVSADAPVAYYRLDEASGTTGYDISGQGRTGVYSGGPTLGVAGAISGDTDTAVTFASASSQSLGASSNASLPTGSGALTLECWLKISAAPGARQEALCIGLAGTANEAAYIAVLSSGKIEAGLWTHNVVSGAAISTGVYHHIVMTSAGGSGGTITLYVDGVSQGTTTATGALTYGTTALTVGAGSGNSLIDYFSGTVDEAAVYATALASGRVTAHYNAGHSGASGTLTNVMSLPAGATVSFGSPMWGAINTWQVRFQFLSGATDTFIHFQNSTNFLRLNITGTSYAFSHIVNGINNVLASGSVTLTHEAWYWLQFTQFPTPASNANAPSPPTPSVQVSILTDAAGAPGATLLAIGPVATKTATAITGVLRLTAAGAAMNVGGPYNNVNLVSLFGPGGWYFNDNYNSATATASGAWDQSTSNTYSGGPVTSFGAARVDFPPAGTATAYWNLTPASVQIGGVTSTSLVMPVAAPGNVIGYSVWLKTSGLSGTAHNQLIFQEFLYTGALNGTTIESDTVGNQGSWTHLTGTYTTSGSCAQLDIRLVSYDLTAGASANGTVWWDNCQVWNVTATGQASMPYCELRFPATPAQLLVSGVVGDTPAPAMVAMGFPIPGAYSATTTYRFLLGRRAQVGATAQLIGAPPTPATGLSPLTVQFDTTTTSYGGYDVGTGSSYAPNTWPYLISQPIVTDMLGTYEVYGRLQVSATATQAQTLGSPILNTTGSTLGSVSSPYVSPFGSANVWTLVDAGRLAIPPSRVGALTDMMQQQMASNLNLSLPSGGSSLANWVALLPVDGDLVLTTLSFPLNNNAGLAFWNWVYVDGLHQAYTMPFATTWSSETYALPNPAQSGGIAGVSTKQVTVNSTAAPYLSLDPTLTTATATGVNQLVCIVATVANSSSVDKCQVNPVATEFVYTPQYLWPN